jgi:hypothetical protein
MKDIFDKVKASISDAAKKTSETVSEVIENENTQAALDWAKQTANTIADEATRLGKEVARSDMVKDAATGAAIGAAVAVPVPIIGPAAGAVVGAGIGVFKNLTKPTSGEAGKVLGAAVEKVPTKELYDELLKLDELRQKGILTDDEFQSKKSKLLDKN